MKLTRAEYNLLTYFLQNPDRVLTREAILNSVWGYDHCPHTRTVDAHVVRLRQKLEPEAGNPRHFLTVHGVGTDSCRKLLMPVAASRNVHNSVTGTPPATSSRHASHRPQDSDNIVDGDAGDH